MRGYLWLMLILLACSSLAHADTTWVAAGNVSGTWTAAHSPYMIGGDISVGMNASLQIDPGVKIYFRGSYRLSVSGTLQALGTVTDTIRFTTDTTANPQRWRGIDISMPDSACRFDYCILEYAAVNGAVNAFDAALIFNHCLLRNNRSDEQGGAIYYISFATPLTVDDCVFEGNQAVDPSINSSAGAVFAANESVTDSISFNRCVFRNNQTTGGGGAVWAMDGPVEFNQCRFIDNHADVVGGGIYAIGILILRECLLYGNSAPEGGGIDYFISGGITLDHCVLDSNIADDGAAISGGGTPTHPQFISNSIFCRSVGSAFNHDGLLPQNCLFWGNADLNFGPNVTSDIIGAIAVENANGDSTDFFRNLYTDPLFVNVAQGDYHLTAASPCIDAGDTLAPPDADGTPTDIGIYSFSQPVALAPRSLRFDPCGVNFWSDTLWVSLRNVTTQTAHILSLSTSQSSFSSWIAPADSVLAAGDTVAIRVICAPDTHGAIHGNLSIHTDLGDARCHLVGEGYGSYLTMAPLVLNYGGVRIGEPEQLQVSLSNLGNALLQVNGVTANAPFAAGDLPESIPAHGARTVDILCNPTVAGTFHDTLVIQSSAYNDPIPVMLIAVGAEHPDPPTVFDLLTPADHDTLPRWWDSTAFSWTASTDPYGVMDPIYVFSLQYGDSVYEQATPYTSLTVSFATLPFTIPEQATLIWWVTANGHPGDTECAARFTLFTADTGDAITPEHLPFLPTVSALLPAYPNPFNAVSTLTFDVAQTGPVTLSLYNLLGENVATLINDLLQQGRYHTTWSATEFSSGSYFAVLQTGDHRFIQKLLLLK